MVPELASVVRDGRKQQVDAAVLVPGDVIALASGDRVPADARLLAQNAGQLGILGESGAITWLELSRSNDSQLLQYALAARSVSPVERHVLARGNQGESVRSIAGAGQQLPSSIERDGINWAAREQLHSCVEQRARVSAARGDRAVRDDALLT